MEQVVSGKRVNPAAKMLTPPRRVLLGIGGGDVPFGCPNPDPILDQKMLFFTPVFRHRL